MPLLTQIRHHTGHLFIELIETANHLFVIEALAMAVLFSATLMLADLSLP
jgi:hypothetical protein